MARPEPGDDTLVESFHRLRGELALEGFSVQVIQFPERPTPLQVRRAAQEAHAFAAVVIARAEGETGVDLWVTDRVTGKMTLQTIRLDDVDDAPSVLAVRAVDLLRNSLIQLRTAPSPPPEVVGVDRGAVPDEVQRFVEPERDYRLAIGALMQNAGAVSPGWGPGLSLDRRITSGLRVGWWVGGALLGASWSTRQGTVRTHQELLLAEASYETLELNSLRLSVSLGAGAYHLGANSEVEPPLVARRDSVVGGAVAAGLILDVTLTRALFLRARAMGVLIAPRPGVQLETDRTLLASPMLISSLGMGAEL